MLELGLEQEIRNLLNEGVPEKCTAMQAIGYKEFVAALAGQCSVAQAADKVRQASRNYAKRQLTWFRRNPEIHVLVRKTGEKNREILETARQIIAESDK